MVPAAGDFCNQESGGTTHTSECQSAQATGSMPAESEEEKTTRTGLLGETDRGLPSRESPLRLCPAIGRTLPLGHTPNDRIASELTTGRRTARISAVSSTMRLETAPPHVAGRSSSAGMQRFQQATRVQPIDGRHGNAQLGAQFFRAEGELRGKRPFGLCRRNRRWRIAWKGGFRQPLGHKPNDPVRDCINVFVRECPFHAQKGVPRPRGDRKRD